MYIFKKRVPSVCKLRYFCLSIERKQKMGLVYQYDHLIYWKYDEVRKNTDFTAVQADLDEMLPGQLTSSIHHHWNFVNLAKISCAILSY